MFSNKIGLRFIGKMLERPIVQAVVRMGELLWGSTSMNARGLTEEALIEGAKGIDTDEVTAGAIAADHGLVF